MRRMVAIKYIGPGRYGTADPKKIWSPDEVQDVPPEAADVLLQDPYFVKVPKSEFPRKEQETPTISNLLMATGPEHSSEKPSKKPKRSLNTSKAA
jgi:hypothetical protein